MLSVFIPWLNIKSEFVNCQIFFWESNVSKTPICQIQPFVIMEDFRSLIACDTFFSGFPLGSSNQFIMITVTCNSISLSFSNQYTFRYLGATRIGHCVIGSTPMILTLTLSITWDHIPWSHISNFFKIVIEILWGCFPHDCIVFITHAESKDAH